MGNATILLITQEVVNKFLLKYLRGGMSLSQAINHSILVQIRTTVGIQEFLTDVLPPAE